MYRLEDWARIGNDRLNGLVYDHPRFEQGARVTTTQLVGYNPTEDWFQTKSGSRYQLGRPSPQYEEMFLNPTERLKASALQNLEILS